MLEAWEFILRRPELLAEWVLAHLWIIFVAITIAVILGVSLGIFITGKGREQLADWQTEWRRLSVGVEEVSNGDTGE